MYMLHTNMKVLQNNGCIPPATKDFTKNSEEWLLEDPVEGAMAICTLYKILKMITVEFTACNCTM